MFCFYRFCLDIPYRLLSVSKGCLVNLMPEPIAVSSPSAMMAIRSERMSASSMKCVESRMVRFCFCL